MTYLATAVLLLAGLAGQSSWWAVATSGSLVGVVMPDLTPMFWFGAMLGLTGLAFSLKVLRAALWSSDGHSNVDDAFNRAAAARRVVISLVVQATAMVAMQLLAFVPSVRRSAFGIGDPIKADEHAQVILLVALCILFCVGSWASLVAQGTFNEMAAHLPTTVSKLAPPQLVWVGGVSCALVMGVLRLAIRAAFADDVALQGRYFYCLSASFSLAGLLSVPAINAMAKAHSADPDRINALAKNDETAALLQDPQPTHGHEATEPDKAALLEASPPAEPVGLVGVLRMHLMWYLVMMIDFAFAMALYPGMLSVLHGKDKTATAFTDNLFLAFNAGDFVGKLLPAVLSISSGRALMLMTMAEIILFVPLVLSSALIDDMHIDALAYAIGALVACSHGLISVNSINAVGARSQNSHFADRRRAGELNFVMCFTGVGLGSIIAVGLSFTPLVAS